MTAYGIRISLPASGSSVIIGTSTVVFNPTPVPASGATAVPGPTNSGLVVQGQTLTPGGLVTIINTPVSLPTSGSALIVGFSTIPLGSVETISVGSQALVLSEGAS